MPLIIAGSSPGRVEEEYQAELARRKAAGLPTDDITKDIRPIVQPNGTISRPVGDYPETQLTGGGKFTGTGQSSTPVQSPPPPQGLQVQQKQPISGTPQQGIGKLPPEALNYTGPSIVDFLNLAQQPSDFTSRTKLAQQYGIQNYTGTAEQNTQLLNTLRQPAKTPINAPTSPVETSLTPTADTQPTPASDTSFGDIFASAGIQGISSPTTTKIEDVVKNISQAFGMDTITKEMEEVEKENAEEIFKTQSNPWLSQGQLSRKLSLINEKYERRKDALISQLRLQQDVVGKSIDIYYKEKEMQQQNLFRALTLRENQIEEQNKQQQQEFENQLAVERLGLERIKSQTPIGIKGEIIESPLAQTVFDNPQLFESLTPTLKGAIAPSLAEKGFKFPIKLSGEQEKTRQSAESALGAISGLEENLYDPDGSINWSNLTFAATGLGSLAYFRREAVDVLTRIRTGAALNESEQEFYAKQAPRIFDSQETIENKLTQLKALYSGLAGTSLTIQSPQGKVYVYENMFNPDIRAEVREAIKNDYKIIKY